MKWLFIILLGTNLVYLGWELNRETIIKINEKNNSFKVPESAYRISLLSEVNFDRTIPLDHQTVQFDSETGNTQETMVEKPSTYQQSVQSFGDVSIEEGYTVTLMTSMPDIVPSEVSSDHRRQKISNMCLTYGPFTDYQQATGLMEWFRQKDIHAADRSEKNNYKQLFWIYLAPQETETDTLETLETLKNKGIQDYRLISTGNLQNAISLGLFSSQDAVNKRLNELKDKGYQPIVVPYREPEEIYWVDVGFDIQEQSLDEIFQSEPARFNSVPVDCTEIALQ